MGNKEVLFLNPVFKESIWGGNRLASEYGYDIPSDNTGECWAVSAHDNGDSTIANGSYKGQKLSDLWGTHRELFGNHTGATFPLLVKIIDAADDLSIQVHPDDAYARIHENGSLGKTECWYVLDCKDGAEIIIGHHAKNKEELIDLVNQKKWEQLLRRVPIHKGDFFQIEPGTIHAILGGTLILEVQQNSDITYRLYDFDRLSDGEPRELHTNKSIDVIHSPFEESTFVREMTKDVMYSEELLIQCKYYFVKKLDIFETHSFHQDSSFLIMSVLEGEGTINGIPIVKGNHFILPYGVGECMLEGKLSLICAGVNAI